MYFESQIWYRLYGTATQTKGLFLWGSSPWVLFTSQHPSDNIGHYSVPSLLVLVFLRMERGLSISVYCSWRVYFLCPQLPITPDSQRDLMPLASIGTCTILSVCLSVSVTVSLIPGCWPWAYKIVEDDLKLPVLLSLPACVPSWQLHASSVTESKSSCMIDNQTSSL